MSARSDGAAARWGRVGMLIGLAAAAGAAIAQTVPDDAAPSPADRLNLPANAQVFGTRDPAVHKATAIVNGDIITDTDVDQRLALVIAANGGKIAPEERAQVREQIVRNLIDESLEIQEAKGNEITISSDEIDQTFRRVAGNFKQQPSKFGAYLSSIGASEASMRRQIEGELAWSRLLRRRVEPMVNISDDEVNAVIARLEAAKGKNEYHIYEIYLPATADTQAQVQANAERIVQQLKGGGSFQAYARQYSEASTAAVGGDLGWVQAEQLPSQLADMVRQMPSGSVSPPVALPGGYSIVALAEQRQVLGVNEDDAVLSLKQVSLKFTQGMTQQQAAPTVEKFAQSMKTVAGCGSAEKAAGTVGAEVATNDNVRFGDLPPLIQNLLKGLQVGQATQPFGSVQSGISALVLCGRDDPPSAQAPSFDRIYAQMEQERVNSRARRYLRDLRRDAVVDYR